MTEDMKTKVLIMGLNKLQQGLSLIESVDYQTDDLQGEVNHLVKDIIERQTNATELLEFGNDLMRLQARSLLAGGLGDTP